MACDNSCVSYSSSRPLEKTCAKCRNNRLGNSFGKLRTVRGVNFLSLAHTAHCQGSCLGLCSLGQGCRSSPRLWVTSTLQTRSDLCISKNETARLVTNFHIHVSVSGLYIFPRSVHLFFGKVSFQCRGNSCAVL